MRSGCVEMIATCRDCGWQYENRKNGLALAAKHHYATGHVVDVEIGNVVTYGESRAAHTEGENDG